MSAASPPRPSKAGIIRGSVRSQTDRTSTTSCPPAGEHDVRPAWPTRTSMTLGAGPSHRVLGDFIGQPHRRTPDLGPVLSRSTSSKRPRAFTVWRTVPAGRPIRPRGAGTSGPTSGHHPGGREGHAWPPRLADQPIPTRVRTRTTRIPGRLGLDREANGDGYVPRFRSSATTWTASRSSRLAVRRSWSSGFQPRRAFDRLIAGHVKSPPSIANARPCRAAAPTRTRGRGWALWKAVATCRSTVDDPERLEEFDEAREVLSALVDERQG